MSDDIKVTAIIPPSRSASDPAKHRFEIVDVAVHRALELEIAVVMRADRARLAAADQAHGASA